MMVEHKDIDFITLLQYTTETIANAFEKTKKYLGSHHSIVCPVSGGADSDIMLDMIWRLDTEKKVEYVFVDTGLEMQATKDHIEYLKDKYEIEIKTVRPKKPINKTGLDNTMALQYENCNIVVCPDCRGRLKLKSKGKYCDKCGQKLDWSE